MHGNRCGKQPALVGPISVGIQNVMTLLSNVRACVVDGKQPEHRTPVTQTVLPPNPPPGLIVYQYQCSPSVRVKLGVRSRDRILY